MIRCVFAALLGAIVAFSWSAASWMILPWHNWDMKSFKNDGQAVVAAIKAESEMNGIYMLPNVSQEMHQHNDEAKNKEWETKAQAGPFAYMNIKVEGRKWEMNTALMIAFLMQFVIANFAVWLLSKSTLNHVIGRALLVSAAVTIGVAFVNVMYWNWWGFPFTTTWVNIADAGIEWFLAGLAIALIKKPIRT